MSSARFIICEQSNRWSVAMRWAVAGTGIRVYETRSWEEARGELGSWPASVLGLELRQDNLEDVVEWLLHTRHSFSRARAIVLTSRELRDAFALLYEAGSVHVVESTRNLDVTARLVRRLLAREPAGECDYRQTVRDRLPWS